MICGIITEVAAIAQLVERIHGKDEVPGSNPGRGSIFYVSEFTFETCPNNRANNLDLQNFQCRKSSLDPWNTQYGNSCNKNLG